MKLVTTFLKTFFRNSRAIFFVILLPAAIFLLLATFGVERVLDFQLDLKYTDFLLPGIIAYAIMQAGVYTVGYTMIDYKRLNILRRLSVTPLTAGRFLWAQTGARFVIALIQTAVLLVLGLIMFSTVLSGQVIFLPLIILIGTIIFVNFGYIIACFARDYEEAAPYTSIAGLALGFLGDVFFPINNLPTFLQQAAGFLPLKPLTAAMRYSLYGVGGEIFPANIIVLLFWLAVSVFVANILFAKKAYK